MRSWMTGLTYCLVQEETCLYGSRLSPHLSWQTPCCTRRPPRCFHWAQESAGNRTEGMDHCLYDEMDVAVMNVNTVLNKDKKLDLNDCEKYEYPLYNFFNTDIYVGIMAL